MRLVHDQPEWGGKLDHIDMHVPVYSLWVYGWSSKPCLLSSADWLFSINQVIGIGVW